MSAGFVSNYTDSGYTVNPGVTWFHNGISTGSAVTVPRYDIYTSGLRGIAGVYMLDGGYSSGCSIYPILCSGTNMSNLGSLNDHDDAWLLYPGFGIQLFRDAAYSTSGIHTYITYNLLTTPQVFACSGSSFATTAPGAVVLKTNDGTTNTSYSNNQTSSVKVYYRNTEITIPGWTT
jgi:hypothetical protein